MLFMPAVCRAVNWSSDQDSKEVDAARRLGEMLLLQLRRDAAPEEISALASPPA